MLTFKDSIYIGIGIAMGGAFSLAGLGLLSVIARLV